MLEVLSGLPPTAAVMSPASATRGSAAQSPDAYGSRGMTFGERTMPTRRTDGRTDGDGGGGGW